MVVFDPRRTETAKVADEHHFVRPGTDAVVLLAMLHVLFEEGLTSSAVVRARRWSRCGSPSRDFTPEYAERASGVPADVIRRITREFAAADGAAAYGRLGLSTQGFGSICQWAIQCLNILTGNFDREGGVLFPEPAVDIVGKAIVGRGHHDVWRSRVRGIPEFGGELPVSTLREEIETPGEGQIRAMLTVAGNPVLSTPDGKRLGEAFDGLDFMAAVDIYLNETTRHADVILPPTTALERDQYDLVFHALAVRNTARFTPAGVRQARGRDGGLGDLPRDRAAHGGPAREEEAAQEGADRAGQAQRQPDDDRHRPAPRRPAYDDAGAAGEPGGRRPRPAATDDAGPAPDPGQADPPRPGQGGRRPRAPPREHRRTGAATSCC